MLCKIPVCGTDLMTQLTQNFPACMYIGHNLCRNFLFVFWKNWKHQKRHFEINWPLAALLKICQIQMSWNSKTNGIYFRTRCAVCISYTNLQSISCDLFWVAAHVRFATCTKNLQHNHNLRNLLGFTWY